MSTKISAPAREPREREQSPALPRWRRGRSPREELSPARHGRKQGMGEVTKAEEGTALVPASHS